MPIKKFTLFVVLVLLFAEINFSNAQETIDNKKLSLKKLSEKISEADDADKIFLKLNSGKSKEFSSSSFSKITRSNGFSLSKEFDNTTPGKNDFKSLSDVSTGLSKGKVDISKYFPPDYKPWESEKHFWWGAGEGVLLNIFIPWAMARYGRTWDSTSEERWPFIGFQSIWNNLNNGWNYDGDNFLTNMFSHPFGGNLFYNSGRTNGMNFWESSAFALGGSFIWETFMETNQPAINDWVITGLGGTAFGEVLYRLSTLATDNTARGMKRVWTEFAGGIFNPARFLTRLVNGEISRVFPNPTWRTPKDLNLNLDAGTRVLINDSTDIKELEGIFELNVEYGDPYRTQHSTPFSHFKYNVQIASSSPNLTGMTVMGSLFAFELDENENTNHTMETSLNYNYLNNPGFLYGNVAITEQLNSQFKLNDHGWHVRSKLGVRLIPMGGTPDDYFLDSTDGRNYDMGQGLGAVGKVSLFSEGWEVFTAQYTMDYLWTQSEPSFSKHFLQGGEFSFQLPVKEYFVIGFAGGYYKRKSYYHYPSGFFSYPTPDVSFQTPMIRVFFKTRLI
ncbi:MAG TPA: DUF3943 domain-containing protein [Ignavibacteria bacterium]|nr:DUF3943 domain-containing protein [Ignavibacteria bacterium]